MTDPIDTEDVADDPIDNNPLVKDDYVGEGGDGTRPDLPETIPDPAPDPRSDDEEGEGA